MDVALFIPCYVDQLAPSVGIATAEVLERAGCRVDYDPDQTCCGQPFVTAGAWSEARRLARRHLDRFAGADAVVCPSASCVATVRRRYAELGLAETPLAKQVCACTYELSEFLVRVLNQPDVGARFPHRVALLQSCHGLRELQLGHPSEGVGVPDPPPGPTEAVLSAVRDLELVLPDPPDECCGFGGLFSVQFPEISTRIGRSRLRALAETGAAYVTATDWSCLLHLEGLRRRTGFGPRTIHLAEILAGSDER
jgi:L-lactate dehydrogenase complex protein LldE